MRLFRILLVIAGGVILILAGIGWQIFPLLGATETGRMVFLATAAVGGLASVGGLLALLMDGLSVAGPSIPVTRAAGKEAVFVPEVGATINTLTLSDLDVETESNQGMHMHKKPPFMADPPPAGYIPRWLEYEEIIEALLDLREGGVVGITTALAGAHGYGKTTLAQAVCRDERVWEAFPDGILWVTIGDSLSHGENVACIGDLIAFIEGRRLEFTEVREAKAYLHKILKNRRTLLVIDGARRQSELDLFLQPGSHTTCLVITCEDETLPPNAPKVRVDEMRRSEAIALLGAMLSGAGVDKEELADLYPELSALAGRCGGWALLTSLVGGHLAGLVGQGYAAENALAKANQAYDQFGLAVFDAGNPLERNRAAEAVLATIITGLEPIEREFLGLLAIFPDNEWVPLSTVEILWNLKGSVDAKAVENLCSLFYRRSFVQQYDPQARAIRMHKPVRSYLAEQKSDQLRELHLALVEGYRQRCLDGQWSQGPRDGYFFQHLAEHLAAAGQIEELARLLLSPAWMAARLDNGGICALLGDYEVGLGNGLEAREEIHLVQRALSLTQGTLAKAPDQLSAQLFGRLAAYEQEDVQQLLVEAGNLDIPLWLQPVLAYFPPPVGFPAMNSAGQTSIEHHSGPVTSVAFAPDLRQVVTGSVDGLLKVWDLESGRLLRSLKGHAGKVLSVIITPNGRRVISTAIKDRAINLWAMENGRRLSTLRSHPAWVKAAFVSIVPDGQRVISSLLDGTLRVSELETGRLVCRLGALNEPADYIAISIDSRWAITRSGGPELCVWDLNAGQLLHSLPIPPEENGAAAISPDGRWAAASTGNALQLWDLVSGQVIRRLAGHTRPVQCVAFFPGGGLVLTGSADGSLKVWDMDDGRLRASLDLNGPVTTCGVSPDGRFVAAGDMDGQVYLLRFAGKQVGFL